MNKLAPLETLYVRANPAAQNVPLPPELTRVYGQLEFPIYADRPYILSNFVSTLDGVVELNTPGYTGGGPISGANAHDRMVMGLLRAVADAVVAGAGTLRSAPRHVWTAEVIYPALAAEYRQVRQTLHKSATPLNVFITGSGAINLGLPVFQSSEVQTLIVTTPQGAPNLSQHHLPPHVSVATATTHQRLTAREIVQAIVQLCGIANPLILVEGGPQVMADFLGEHLIDEQFLTLAPQVAGRDASVHRLALVEGKLLAPHSPVWGTLLGIKRAGEFLFLRYAFPTDSPW